MGRHRELRRELKKQKRKTTRQQNAKRREEEKAKIESSPSYQAWLKEQEEAEEVLRAEELLESERRNEKWIVDELKAQQQFKLQQLEKGRQDAEITRQKAELLKEIQAREEKRKKEELEKEERLKYLEEQNKIREERIEDFLQNGSALPDDVRISIESNPLQPSCPFFQKVAVCRFGDACSRNHVKPSISCFLLVPSMFSHPSLLVPGDTKSGDQEWFLEYADSEIQSDYNDFFEDVCSEVEKLGRILRFYTCCNREHHLRGNVYIQLANERDSLRVCRNLSGRWFGGKRLQPYFIDIASWKNAICGLFSRGKCPKGRYCNFMHIFPNPRRLFMFSPPRQSVRLRRSRSPASVEASSLKNSSRRSSRSSSRQSKRKRSSRSPSRSERRSRRRHEDSDNENRLAITTRERSLSPWSPGRRLTTDS